MHECVIIGGGIVELATAMDVCKKYPKASVLVLEKERDLAQHQTGRNSGVIHSGIYYKPGNLKARFAVEGNHTVIRFCREQGVKHEVCGKVIVATKASEFPRLSAPRLRVEGWRSWRLQSEICFRFYRRTLMKATGANGQRTETARHLSWKSWIENTETVLLPGEKVFHSSYLNNSQLFTAHP